MPRARRDPYFNFNFLVEVDGNAISGVSEVDLPEARIEIASFREGGERTNASRLLPGHVDYGSLVLRRGYLADPTLFRWWQAVADGTMDRRNVVVVLRDETGQEVSRWRFHNALPTKWVGPSLNARANDVAMESLELAVESIELEQ